MKAGTTCMTEITFAKVLERATEVWFVAVLLSGMTEERILCSLSLVLSACGDHSANQGILFLFYACFLY